MSRPPRVVGFAYTGPYRYLITSCTHLRRPVFGEDEAAAQTLEQFRFKATEDQFAILAYCLMPDHLHLLVEGLTDRSDLRRFMRIAKQRSGNRYSRQIGSRLWQEGYHDRVLRPDDDVRVFARYVLENPVRAGLVDAVGNYKHAGSDVWSIAEILEDLPDRRTQ